MRISVLAWGSVIWDRQKLKVLGDFEPIGPRLPLEFCRVSRDGRLTLVIDDSFGAPCITYSAVSSFNRLDHAIENLRERENMPGPKGVGFVVPEIGKQSETAVKRHPKALKTIAEWVATAGFDAAIWTALATNFTEKTKKHFSVKAAIRYLENLDKDAQDTALTYVRNAPREIQTPLREAMKVRWRAP